MYWVWKKNKCNISSVLSKLSNHHAIIVYENRKYIESISFWSMLAVQSIAFYGHFED